MNLVQPVGATGVIIRNTIICYPNLFQPRQANPNDRPKFSADFVLPAAITQEELQLITQQMMGAAAAKLDPSNLPANYRWPEWKDGAKFDPEFAGRYVLGAKANAEFRPQVLEADGRTVCEDPSRIFGGCQVGAYINFYSYAKGPSWGPGCAAGLNGVQIEDNINVRRLGSAQKDARDVFGAVEGAPQAPVQAFVQPGPAPGPGPVPPGAPQAAPQPAPQPAPAYQGPTIPGIS
jgi:hypothetical protein